MTSKEAIELIKINTQWECYSKVYMEAVYIGLEALEKQVPKKPLNIKQPFSIGYGKCSKCGEEVEEMSNYCPDCGQKLDWWSENEVN